MPPAGPKINLALPPFLRQTPGMRGIRTLGIFTALTLSLTGCGESSNLYPSSKADGVYFSIPKNWTGISTEALNKYERKASDEDQIVKQSLVKWQVAYSLDPDFKVETVFTLKPPSSPLIFARVRDLTGPEFNEFSYNSLRNVIVPVTQLSEGEDLGIPDFKILLDEEIVEEGARGVHTIYSFSLDGIKQTLNQTVLMSSDRMTVYILMARCATTCYTKNKKSIEEIVSSYTVQGAK